MPMLLALSGVYSVDGIVIGIVAIFIGCCLKLYEQKDKISIKQLLILVGMFTLLGTLKSMGYISIGLVIFILPIIKIIRENKKYIAVIILLAILSVVLNLFINYSLSKEQISDTRVEGTDAGAQIQFIKENPATYGKILSDHTKKSLINFDVIAYLNAPMFFGKNYYYVFFFLFLYMLYTGVLDDSKNFGKKQKAVFIGTFIITFIITSTMLYISYTKVGEKIINGFQPRYLYPMIPLLLMCFSSDRVKRLVDNGKEARNIAYISSIFIILSIIGILF